MLADIETITGSRLGPGTLYGAIERLERDGLIAALPSHDRRVPYQLTDAGYRYLAGRVAELRRLVTVATGRMVP